MGNGMRRDRVVEARPIWRFIYRGRCPTSHIWRMATRRGMSIAMTCGIGSSTPARFTSAIFRSGPRCPASGTRISMLRRLERYVARPPLGILGPRSGFGSGSKAISWSHDYLIPDTTAWCLAGPLPYAIRDRGEYGEVETMFPPVEGRAYFERQAGAALH